MRASLFKLVTYSIPLALFWCGLQRHFDLLEVGMVSNWFYASRLSKFPIWYTQAMLQMFLALAVLFYVLDLTPKLQRRPVVVTMALLIAAMVLGIVSKLLWDTTYLDDKLPQLQMWNVIVGWLFWAVLVNRTATARDRILFVLMSVVSSYVMFVEIGLVEGVARFCWFSATLVVIVWVPQKILLPGLLAHVVALISQASLYIFLLHRAILLAFDKIGAVLGGAGAVWFNSIRFLIAVGAPLLIWAFATAVSRTWSRRPARPAPSSSYGHQPKLALPTSSKRECADMARGLVHMRSDRWLA